MKKLLFLFATVSLLLVRMSTYAFGIEPISTTEGESMPQGLGVFAIAITQDGEYAYLSFDLSEVIFKVRIEDLSVVAVADLTEYFPIECEDIVLDVSEEKLFAYTPTWRKLLVIDTQTMKVIHTITNINIVKMIQSQYGPFIIVWGTGSLVIFINTTTYEIIEFVDERMDFQMILESENDPNHWYVVSGLSSRYVVGKYDFRAKAWVDSVSFTKREEGEAIYDFKFLPNEQKAYIGTLGGWYPEGAFGWLYSVDLLSREVNVVFILGGVLCLESSINNRWLYVGGFGKASITEHKIFLLVVDTKSDSIVDQIFLAELCDKQTNDLQIDPANPHLLYATGGDAFFKVNLDDLTCIDMSVFSQHILTPHWFVRNPRQATGYILIERSANAFKLDLDSAAIEAVVELPGIRDDAFSYDAAIDDSGRMLIAQGETILEVDVEDMRLIENHPILPLGSPSVWHFVLSNDQKKIYTITYGHGPEGITDIFVAINTESFHIETQFGLEGNDGINFEFRPYELPDGSKLYIKGGSYNGPIIIKVIETENYTIQKTITFDEPGLMGTNIGGWHAFAYDSSSHTLFVECKHVVLAINTDTDVIQKVIYLGDVANAIGIEAGQLTYNGAAGLVYHPNENYLYIAHYDRSFISIYDLNNNQFLPQVIPLKGHLPTFLFANDDYNKIYCLNGRTDNISVIDVASKTEEKVIDLNDPGILPPTPPIPSEPVCDFNEDGNINIADVISLLFYQRDNPDDLKADFNQDGMSNIADAISMILAMSDETCP